MPVSGQIWNNLCGLARSKTLWGVLLLAVLWGYGYAMNTPAVDMDDLAIATYQQGGEFLRQGRITVWLLQALTGIMTYQRFWPELFFALSLVLAGILLPRCCTRRYGGRQNSRGRSCWRQGCCCGPTMAKF